MSVLTSVVGLVSNLPDCYIQRIDYANATTEYVGYAVPKSATSDATWQIRRTTVDSSGRPTVVLYADGNVDFDNVWDNRATLSYS